MASCDDSREDEQKVKAISAGRLVESRSGIDSEGGQGSLT